jgi:endopeptidase Clp ATP-binding regulatory subunit ClpX
MEQKPQFKTHLQNIPKPEADTAGYEEGISGKRTGGGIDFRLKPEELESYLNQYVVDQPEAVAVLATKICTHFNRMRLEMEEEYPEDAVLGNIKSNILMIGPTGVGKTYIVKLIAHRIGVPFVKGDATKFSETGYVGGDVEDLVRELVREADGDIKLAEYGIIYIDEIDKIAAAPGGWGPDVSRTGVQRNLLKLMEETEVDMKVPHDLASQMEAVMQAQKTGKAERKKVNTRNILFVVSGAFDGIADHIRRRLAQRSIGFKGGPDSTARTETDLLRQVTSRDLIQYGFESEFIGRLPVIVVLNELTEESLYRILVNPNSAVIQAKKREFRAYGIQLEFEDEALRLLAHQAAQEKTGARGILSAVERTLVHFEKRLPTLGVKKLRVTRRLIEHPEEAMREIIFEHSLDEFAAEFEEKSGVALKFHPDARRRLETDFAENPATLAEGLRQKLKDYIYGVKLLGVTEFEISAQMLDEPTQLLDRMIKEAYEKRRRSEESAQVEGQNSGNEAED